MKRVASVPEASCLNATPATGPQGLCRWGLPECPRLYAAGAAKGLSRRGGGGAGRACALPPSIVSTAARSAGERSPGPSGAARLARSAAVGVRARRDATVAS